MSDPLPQPSDVPIKDREDAMGAYLMVFAALHLGLPLPFLGLIAALIYHVVNGKKSPFTGFHTYQSLLFSIPASIVSAVWVVWAVMVFVAAVQDNFVAQNLTPFWVFTVFSLLLYLVYLVYCIVGAVLSRKGRLVYFPFFGRLAYDRYFGLARNREPKPEVRNEPPKGF
jgi:uncharacterized Tic20 family protein